MSQLYAQLRKVYRDLEQRRADIFYDMKRSEARTQELRLEYAELDRSLQEYQAKIKQIETEGEIE